MSAWIEDIIVKNQYSRPAFKLLDVRGIVMHWTADFGASDENEHNFFDGSDGGGGRYASAHFFVDNDSATMIIPLDEVAYHANEHSCRIAKLKGSIIMPNGRPYVGDANVTTIGVEMCVEKNGTIHQDTVSRAVDVVVELCKKFNLDPINDIYMHYNITGKDCPRPWVQDEKQFIDFKNRVKAKLNPPKAVEAASTVVSAPTWDGVVLNKGQIGRLTILKPINLWKDSADGKLEMVRVLQPNETYRVYGYRDDYSGQYNLGGTWVTKMDGYVKYETPSAAKLKDAQEYYKNN